MPLALTHPQFDRIITLRDAYRIMQRFTANYLARGDTAVSDFLHCYASEVESTETTDPAAASDFIEAADQVLPLTRLPDR